MKLDRVNQGIGLGALAIALTLAAACSSKSSGSPNSTPQDAGATDAPISNNADAGDDGSDQQGDQDAGPTPQCDEYCKAVMANCTGQYGAAGSHAQYPTMASCTALCGQINAGEYNDPDGDDTLGCRLVHANRAKTDPAGNCVAAGPSGGGVCNDVTTDAGANARCLDFCAQTMALCTVDNGVNPPPYTDQDACMAACGNQFKFDTGQPERTQSGNTLNCREYYLGLAYDQQDGDAGAAVYHCPHLASPASAFCR